MFIVFKTRSQAENYIKRNKNQNYSRHEGCGCCYCYSSLFLDGNKVVKSYVDSSQGFITATATVIGKIIGRKK